jgi:four helix bundle protein
MKENVILDKSFAFAIQIVVLSKCLQDEQREFVLSRQILRSGTFVGANVEEAVGGISKREFAVKMQIAYKEARETRYWPRLLKTTNLLDQEPADTLITDCEELIRVLVAIILLFLPIAILSFFHSLIPSFK